MSRQKGICYQLGRLGDVAVMATPLFFIAGVGYNLDLSKLNLRPDVPSQSQPAENLQVSNPLTQADFPERGNVSHWNGGDDGDVSRNSPPPCRY